MENLSEQFIDEFQLTQSSQDESLYDQSKLHHSNEQESPSLEINDQVFHTNLLSPHLSKENKSLQQDTHNNQFLYNDLHVDSSNDQESSIPSQIPNFEFLQSNSQPQLNNNSENSQISSEIPNRVLNPQQLTSQLKNIPKLFTIWLIPRFKEFSTKESDETIQQLMQVHRRLPALVTFIKEYYPPDGIDRDQLIASIITINTKQKRRRNPLIPSHYQNCNFTLKTFNIISTTGSAALRQSVSEYLFSPHFTSKIEKKCQNIPSPFRNPPLTDVEYVMFKDQLSEIMKYIAYVFGMNIVNGTRIPKMATIVAGLV